MIVKSIRVEDGFFSRHIEFSENANLIYSQKNGEGKTSLLRILLYSFGYNIPNTKGFEFEHCKVETVIVSEKLGEVLLLRSSNTHVVAVVNNKCNTFVLPEQQKELHSIIYGTTNSDILANILGAFYLDQEKGWTLLNRGKVVGSIHFNIEDLIRGLSNRDCSALIQKKKRLAHELSKYKQIFSVAKYQELVESENGTVATEDYGEKIDYELEQLRIRQKSLKKELHRLDRAINDNIHFSKFIADMKLLVKAPDESVIPVTAENLIGFDDSIEYIIAKRKLVSAELVSIHNTIESNQRLRESENEQLSFWDSETMTQAFDRRIASLPIDAVAIAKKIERLKNDLRKVKRKISDSTRVDNSVVDSLYQNVLRYAVELGIGNDVTFATPYLFTSNLKELSGALLHKTVFAFRLGYIIEIKKAIGLKLPIILDSPSGKEVDRENVNLMINILKRDFSSHQIIIASIFKYAFDQFKVIKIENRLLDL